MSGLPWPRSAATGPLMVDGSRRSALEWPVRHVPLVPACRRRRSRRVPESTSESERRATGEVARVDHEVRAVLRVTFGARQNRTICARQNGRRDGREPRVPSLGAHPRRAPLWDALRPSVRRARSRTPRTRCAAMVDAADGLGRLDAASHVELGESQRYPLDGALALYHYVNPSCWSWSRARVTARARTARGRARRAPGARRHGGHGARAGAAVMVDRPDVVVCELEDFLGIERLAARAGNARAG